MMLEGQIIVDHDGAIDGNAIDGEDLLHFWDLD